MILNFLRLYAMLQITGLKLDFLFYFFWEWDNWLISLIFQKCFGETQCKDQYKLGTKECTNSCGVFTFLSKQT